MDDEGIKGVMYDGKTLRELFIAQREALYCLSLFVGRDASEDPENQVTLIANDMR